MTQNSINNSASEFTVDNLFLDGNTISSLDTNGNIILDPDGTGNLSVTDPADLLCSGDRAQNLGSTTNAWDNLYINGVSFDDGTNVWDAFTEYTTFTPTIEYAGGQSGITYTTQNGYYYRIGDLVFTVVEIVLSNKGTATSGATAQVRIASLPFAYESCFSVQMGVWTNVTLTANYFYISGLIPNTTSYAQMQQSGINNNYIDLQFQSLANNSSLRFSAEGLI